MLTVKLEVDLVPPRQHLPHDSCAGLWHACYLHQRGWEEVADGKEVRNFNGKDYLMEICF